MDKSRFRLTHNGKSLPYKDSPTVAEMAPMISSFYPLPPHEEGAGGHILAPGVLTWWEETITGEQSRTWERHEKDVALLSSRWSEIVFTLEISTTHNPGWLTHAWKKYFQNGWMQTAHGELNYSPFDPARLRRVEEVGPAQKPAGEDIFKEVAGAAADGIDGAMNAAADAFDAFLDAITGRDRSRRE